jgi:hypothetical protein
MELNGENAYKSDLKFKKNGIILRIGLSLDPFYLENRNFYLWATLTGFTDEERH